MEILLGAAILIIVALVFVAWRYREHAAQVESRQASIHARLEALEKARASGDDKLRALMRATSDGIIQVNEHGTITDLNQTARNLLGVADGVGLPLREVAWGLDLQTLVHQVMSEESGMLSQTVVKGDRAFSVRVVPIEADGEGGALLCISEVTELQRLGRARREFVANISHELRTPVTSLQLIAETITPEMMDDKRVVSDLLDKARAQIDLLKQLTDELMDLALIESGQAPIKLVSVFASELVTDALTPLLPQAERKRITVETHIPPDMEVLADPQAIRKVISNLTHNAIKFTPDGGRVTVAATWRNEGADVEFSIKDTGPGIPAQDLSRIFERFYKVDRARTRAQGELRGTGLGLAIAKHIVEAHGGKLWAESVEGAGSTFYFTLPSGE